MQNMPEWVPTPTFLYRNYLYEKIINEIKRTSRYLLVGIGTGYFINKLEAMGFKGTALDISKSSIKVAKEVINPKLTKLIEGNIVKYNSQKKFDLVLSFEVLEHIKDDQAAINNIYKLLSPKGLFVFSVPAHMSKWGQMDEMGGHYRRYERKEIVTKLQKAGFKISKIMTFGFPFLNVVQKTSKSGVFTQKQEIEDTILAKTKNSGIRTDYNPKYKFLVSNKYLLTPLFFIMNLFISTDWGIGYIVTAKKSK